MVAEHRQQPRDDYIPALIAKRYDGAPLSDKMLVNFCLLLLIAGIDTTWSSIGLSMYYFAAHPQHRKRVAVEADLFPRVIAELLRFYAPVAVGRIAMNDVDTGGVSIQRGERVTINYPAANRDAKVFDDAGKVILDRQKNRHFAFGVGIHRCAGSNLARIEMEVALRT